MPWRKMLAYITGTVDQELLLRNELTLPKTKNAARITLRRRVFSTLRRGRSCVNWVPSSSCGMHLALHLLALIRALTLDRSRLALENLVLRQQLNVLRRGVKRAKLDDSDRIFWILIRRLFNEWKEHLVVVKPETVIRWHRQGFRYYWKWKSRPKGGRPSIAPEVVQLIESTAPTE